MTILAKLLATSLIFGSLSADILFRPAAKIIGIECRTLNSPTAAPHDIPELWNRFYKEEILNKIPNKASTQIVALYCDYEGDHTQPYTLVIGAPVTDLDHVPEGMVGKEIPASSYAVYHARGEHPKVLIETWKSIWKQDLERTYTGDFEIYDDKFFYEFPQESDVFIAIKGFEVSKN